MAAGAEATEKKVESVSYSPPPAGDLSRASAEQPESPPEVMRSELAETQLPTLQSEVTAESITTQARSETSISAHRATRSTIPEKLPEEDDPAPRMSPRPLEKIEPSLTPDRSLPDLPDSASDTPSLSRAAREDLPRRRPIESQASELQEQAQMRRQAKEQPSASSIIGRVKPDQSPAQIANAIPSRPRPAEAGDSAMRPPSSTGSEVVPSGKDISIPIPDIEALVARGPLPSGATRSERDLAPAMSIPFGKWPTGKIEGARLRGATGQYTMEIIVKEGNNYFPRTMSLDKSGQPFVQLHDTEVYAIRLTNHAPYDVAVDLRIDGVNCFAFSDEPLRYWILPSGQPMTVMGWHRNGSMMTEFKVVSESPQSAAARLNLTPSAAFGLITATIHAAWPKGAAPPDDEPQAPVEEARRGKPTTGFGQNLTVKTAEVEREIGAPRDLIWVRYDR
jgi:hypothetical protein